MKTVGQAGLIAGFLASIIALIFGSAVGGLGVSTAVAAAARTAVGGWLILLVIGTTAGYIYTFVKFNEFFGKEALVKGAAYGVVIWIITLVLAGIFPVLGEAAFAQPLRAGLFLQLLTYLVWGSALGLFYKK